MRFLLLIVLTMATVVSFSQTKSEIVKREYKDGIELDSIPYPGGSFTAIHEWVPEGDREFHSANIWYYNSKIGGISDCQFTLLVREDSVYAFLMETVKEEATSQLSEQVMKQFGAPGATVTGELDRRVWFLTDATGRNLFVSIDIVKKGKKGQFVIVVTE